MNIVKPLAIVALGVSMALAGGSSTFAKGHDMGVADGTPLDARFDGNTGVFSRNGVVSGQLNSGIGGGDCFNGFCGVVDADGDLNYGQDIVQDQIAAGTRNVTPVVNNRK